MNGLFGFLEGNEVTNEHLCLKQTELFSVIDKPCVLTERLKILESAFDARVIDIYNRIRKARQSLIKLRSVNQNSCSKNETRVLSAINILQLTDCSLLRVDTGYYSRSLHERAIELGALSENHLCKSLLYKGSDDKFYLLIVQYTHEVDINLVTRYLTRKSTTKVELRLATDIETQEIAGFQYNAVPPVGLRKQSTVQIIVANSILKLIPHELYLGGGDVHTKLYVKDISNFCRKTKAIKLDFSHPREE